MPFELAEEKQKKLEELCAKYAVSKLKLFGSAVSSGAGPESDLDFLVAFDEPPTGMGLSTQFFGLHEELEALFGIPVDLLEESAIENVRLKQSVEASAVTLYAA